jgi:biopolymer transport protein ExbB
MQSYSLVHVWAQGDFVTRGIAIVLLAMSLLSWSVMAQKAVTVLRLRRLTKNAEREFWHSDDFASGIDRLGQTPRAPHENPFLALALSGQEAADHHKRTRPHLHDQLDVSEWVSRCLNDTIENRVAHLQSGLGVLASIGSTAPFVGLFGTVWGIHRALLTIGTTGASSIDQIAGPIGEALVMTAFGLAVATPAVLGYNALTRSNRAIVGGMRRFAHTLHAYFVTGAPLAVASAGGLHLAALAS